MNSVPLLFSVIIPLYNKERTIAATLISVLSQKLRNFEVIVVNDGSTDGSLQVAESFSNPKLKVLSKPNGGVSDARNYGIQHAQFPYVTFLDADDCWDENFLEEMACLISRFPDCGMYSSAYRRVTKLQTILHGSSLPEGVVPDFFQMKFLHSVPCSSAVVVRKSVFDSVGGFPIGMFGGEDEFTWSKIAIKYKVAFTPQVLAQYNYVSSVNAMRKGKMDTCKESWFDLYKEGDFYRNEFIAKKAINAGIRYAFGQPQKKSVEIQQRTKYTELSKEDWQYLAYLNRLPYAGIVLLRNLQPRYKGIKRWLKQKKLLLLASR
ncbi:glycosyltransferase family 2 protein [Pontibacter akesuensis]|uniref:Glycosyl transferase family 2 n=1 Tax=Pontibacter akesuensis TaxID=388950 RepID=A0A1I7J205_9BACT|nr:glycosyltransferase family A protein [Pontibacter akesuensis]GHA72877.1 hypothetical protein GCM10007389_28400 [Pontibacter akesuensis]SFU79225.1 Glycosyl transferase family 2 [Pontibacter akesuensis]